MNKIFLNPKANREEHATRHARRRNRIRVGAGDARTRAPVSGENSPEGVAVDARQVAAFLVLLAQPLSWLKLQDLLYYAQAWHLVWDGEALFTEPILATSTGVRIESIDKPLAKKFSVVADDLPASQPTALSQSQQQTVSGIVRFYAGQSHFRLVNNIMLEEPWLAARTRAGNESTPEQISTDELRTYFASLE
jgi:uncharacterized phage-associated protein